MKIFIIALNAFLVNIIGLIAQDTLYVTEQRDTLYLPWDTIYITLTDSSSFSDTLALPVSIDSALVNLDTIYMQRSILLEKALLNSETLSDLDGVTDSIYGNVIGWSLLHTRLYRGSVRYHQTMLSWDSLLVYHDTVYSQGYIPIAIMNVGAIGMKSSVFEDSLIGISADGRRLIDIEGRESSPYEVCDIFYAIPLEPSISAGDTAYFLVDTTRFYVTNREDSIHHIEVDFGDGRGYRSVVHNLPVAVFYNSSGTKEMRVRLIRGDTSTDTLTAWSRVEVLDNDVAELIPEEVKGPTLQSSHSNSPDVTFNVTADHSYNNVKGKGNVSIWYGCNHTALERPFVLVPGFDFIDIRSPNDIYTHYRSFFDSLRDNGYDIVIIDYEKGGDYIQRNAFLFEKMINDINSLKTGNEQLVIMGESMGGLVARYALADMEQNRNEDPETRLYVSFDSPHQGAYVPIGLFYLADLIDDFKDRLTGTVIFLAIVGGAIVGALLGGGVGLLIGASAFVGGIGGLAVGISVVNNLEEKLAQQIGKDLDDITMEDILDSKPAIAQMLYFTPESDDNALLGFNMTMEHPERVSFLADMNQVGYPNPSNLPSGIRKVAITNGDITGRSQRQLRADPKRRFRPGPDVGNEKMLTFNGDGNLVADINAEIWATPNSSQGKKKIFKGNYYSFPGFWPGGWSRRTFKDASTYCWECLPGGSSTVPNNLVSIRNQWPIKELTVHEQSSCFIPTVSALDLETTSMIVDVPSFLTSNPDKIPFDAYYASPRYYNQIHIFPDFEGSKPTALHNLIANELYGEYDAYIQCLTITGQQTFRGRRSITAGTNVMPPGGGGSAPTCPVIVSNTATSEWVAGKKITLQGRVSILAGSNFTARIDPTIVTSCVYTPQAENTSDPNMAKPNPPDQLQSEEENSATHIEPATPGEPPVTLTTENGSATHIEPATPGEPPVTLTTMNIIPNPATGTVVVHYNLSRPGPVTISLSDAQGKPIKTLLAIEDHPIGSHEIEVNVSDLASGIYLCTMLLENHLISEKLSIIR
ncbi:MAG: T9SS type A sorting domain-containing protein [Chlorobi bacterium]|nr:T9SS type A sorting domain-containing protein [Chlorobiota bacterium]